MILNKLKLLGIGQKLILSYIICLIIIITSIISSIVILHKIEASKNSLVDQSIPALKSVSAISTYAHDLVNSVINMSKSNSIKELKSEKDISFKSIKNLNDQLVKIQANPYYDDSRISTESILSSFEDNLILEYETLKTKLELQDEHRNNIEIMRNALDAISQITSLKKINIKAEISELEFKSENIEKADVFRLSSIRMIDSISELIARTAQIRKDLRLLEIATSKENLLSIQQDFDHSLRIITRSVVSNKELGLRDTIGPHILTLIKYGQDAPDIFESQLSIIESDNLIIGLHNENFAITKKLNDSVNLLSETIEYNSEKSSLLLSDTISNSKLILSIIAAITILLFVLIIWKFVYSDIILRLSKLSIATKKLSGDDLSFEIDTSGHDEFSYFATTLNKLKKLIALRKKNHEEIKTQSELLRRSNEDLNLFAYVASHDLQEPLRVVSSYSQLLSKRYSNALDEDADKFINYVVSGCSRMESLIEGLLRLSRIDTQKADYKSIWVEDVLSEIKNDYQLKINDSFALVSWDDMPTIYCDPVHIRTVFQNLISNALKYNHSTPPKIKIKAEQEDSFWKFYVEDNGIGIDKKYLDKVFVIFKRLHSREKYSGTGIGLSICKKIIERYGGEIKLESTPNEGSVFIFTFPIDDRFKLNNTNKIAA